MIKLLIHSLNDFLFWLDVAVNNSSYRLSRKNPYWIFRACLYIKKKKRTEDNSVFFLEMEGRLVMEKQWRKWFGEELVKG